MKSRKNTWLFILVCFLACGFGSVARGAPTLDEVKALVTEPGVKTTLEEFTALDSRVFGYAGNAKAADLVVKHLEGLGYGKVDLGDHPEGSGPGGAYAGKSFVDRSIRIDTFEAPSPVDRGSWLEVAVDGGRADNVTMHALWPNLVRTSQLPRSGLAGHLIWVGRGTYGELDGRSVEGSIALMDFNCAKNYVDVRDLGAQAIVFVEPEDTGYEEASVKMLGIPVNIPRFYLKRADAKRLVEDILTRRLKKPVGVPTVLREAAVAQGVAVEARTDFDVLMDLFGRTVTGLTPEATVTARAHCRMPWERAKGRNIYTVITGTDPELRKEVVVVQAFYDSTSVVPGVAPGAQNAGGIVALLELAKVLKTHPPKRTVVLLATGNHYVTWEGIADWLLRHAPRGGTEQQKAEAKQQTLSPVVRVWVARWVSLGLSVIFAAAVLGAFVARGRAAARADLDAQAAQRVAGMSSCFVVCALVLIGALIVTVLVWFSPAESDAAEFAGYASALDKASAAVKDKTPEQAAAWAKVAAELHQHAGRALNAHRTDVVGPVFRTASLAASVVLFVLTAVMLWLMLAGTSEEGAGKPSSRARVHFVTYLVSLIVIGFIAFLVWRPVLFGADAKLDMDLFVRITATFIALALIGVIVWASIRTRHWHGREDVDATAARKASGLSSLRFVVGLLLIPAALVALLSNIESTGQFETLEPIAFENDAKIKFFFSLDLSSGSSDLGVFFDSPGFHDRNDDPPGKSHNTYMAQYAKRLVDYAESGKMKEKIGVRVENCVDPKGRAAADFVPSGSYFLDGNVAVRTGNPCISFMTIEDLRERVDTPLDDAGKGRVDYANLAAQTRAVCAMVSHAASDEGFLRNATQAELKDWVKMLTTRVVEANYRESFVADTPVVDALVVYRQGWSNYVNSTQMNYHGVRGFRVVMTDANGEATDRLLQAAGMSLIQTQTVPVRAYKLSADDGRIIYAPDRGEQGEKSYPIDVGVSHPVFRHQQVVFRCEPIDFYHLDNSRYLRAVGSGGVEKPIIFDVNDATPQEYGYEQPESQNINTGVTENVMTVYIKKAPPGSQPNRVKVLMGSTVFGLEYLATNTQEAVLDEKATGDTLTRRSAGMGYPGTAPYTVHHSALNAARDMIRIDQWRMDRFEQYGVVKPYDAEKPAENQRLPVIHHKARTHLASAVEAFDAHEYLKGRRHLDKALGFEARAYPDVKGTANDIVKGFMFYCILLLPFAFFCERLFFGFGDVRKQLAGFAGFFLLIFAIMAFVHPVFRITDAPYVILLAFIILVLAVSVLFIIVAKFNEQMAKMRRKAAKVHEADVGRLSATGTAVMLGISNMKKRKVRTTLTTLTLILLTFTVMSFTSVKSETVYNEIPQSHKAAYEGLLLRDLTWYAVEPMALDQYRRHFGAAGGGKVVPRSWMSCPGGSSTVNYKFILQGQGDRETDCQGLVGIMPDEKDILFARPIADGILTAGRWFEKGDADVIILPNRVAYTLLGFTEDQVKKGEAFVQTRGVKLQLIGVLDSSKLEQVRDLDDELYTPVDVGTKSPFGEKLKTGQFSENIVEILKLPHLPTAAVGIVPYDTCMKLGGRTVSAAVVFDEGYDFEETLREFLERVGMTVFIGRDGNVTAYSSIAMSQIGDVGNLFIPIMIAALIVLNTMMGSVHERAHEIGIYSSVGLAPVHIAALFLAESCVYAVMGAISGYLLGTIVGAVVSALDIPGLTLNYSSLSAVFSTLVVMATVILSTLYPARMAASMSVPDVTRQWKFSDPEGDLWRFDFPFTVATKGVLGLFIFLDNYFDGYKEESIGSFYADHIRVYTVDDTYGRGYVVDLDVWLAPFDLSVSQNVQLRALPTEDEGITRIEMQITRLSGEVSNWMRLNRGFLTLMRKQFLIWRTVPAGVKEDYRLEGEKRLSVLAQEA